MRAPWHDLRHFCATQLLELGLSCSDVAIQLRDKDQALEAAGLPE